MDKKDYIEKIKSQIREKVKNYSSEEKEDIWNNMPDKMREDMLKLIEMGIYTEDEVLERCHVGFFFTEDDIPEDIK